MRKNLDGTGKDLSTADLVRNFVLMGLPMDEQEDLYANYWRKIEETLGADSYDEVFDEFLRNWLTVINAPTSIVARDVYRLFKRHVMDNATTSPGRWRSFSRRFAATQGTTRTSRPVSMRIKSSASFSPAFRSLMSQL